tara:strand:+ start:57663 stop:57824 length:162 start_codon:yes stop_codon:yes gene_type:complete
MTGKQIVDINMNEKNKFLKMCRFPSVYSKINTNIFMVQGIKINCCFPNKSDAE